MKLTIKSALFAFSAEVLLILSITAGPIGRTSLSGLTVRSDAIVVGSVQSVFEAGAVTVTITTEQVLKGAVTPGTLVTLVWPVPQESLPVSSKGRPSTGHGIFFLQRNPSGSWSILSAMNGDVTWEDTYIHTPPNLPKTLRDVAAASVPVGDSPLDSVFVELTIAAEAGAPTPFDLVANFRQSPSPVLAAAFTRFLQNPKLEAIGLRGSILTGDPAPLLTIRRDYANLSSSRGWPELLGEIKSYYLNATPVAVQMLGEIATDNTVRDDLRIATAGVLARMHTQQTLPHLATLLSDKNVTVRIFAAGGMASFANNLPIGSHEPAAGPWPYRTDDTIAHSAFDAANVAFWESWWQQNQSKLAQ
jgi:hypothetical protein